MITSSSYSSAYTKKTGQVTSRMARNEQAKMLRQTYFFLGSAIILLLLFIFVILPGAIRVVNSILGNSTAGLVDSDSLPPQIPIIAAPAEATYSAQLHISGFGEAESEVIAVLNGEEHARQKVSGEGEFDLEISLTEGENQLSLYAVDQAGNESNTTQTYAIALDHEAPQLVLIEPQDGQQIELRRNQTLTIKGTTEPQARVFVNGRLVLANGEGGFQTTYQLQEGENKLELKAVDKAGNTTDKTMTVSFRF